MGRTSEAAAKIAVKPATTTMWLWGNAKTPVAKKVETNIRMNA